ncbi:hypothetical protein OG978_30935 [Streptomyces sp. NBC_01591]|nr:hypothetical protein OG978_30935 [Streptomyces sp. NBC_01591]
MRSLLAGACAALRALPAVPAVSLSAFAAQVLGSAHGKRPVIYPRILSASFRRSIPSCTFETPICGLIRSGSRLVSGKPTPQVRRATSVCLPTR